MGTLTLYAIKSSITLMLLYLPYTLLLRKDTFFRFNRMALLTIVAISLIVPYLDIPFWDNPLAISLLQQEEAMRSITLPTLIVGVPLPSHYEGGDSLQHLITMEEVGRGFILIYAIGMLLCLAWKVVGFMRLMHFFHDRCLWTDTQEGATIYCHAGQVSPFSWMRSIVIGETDIQTVSPVCSPSPVLLHELAHVRMGHSWDVLLLSLVEVLQWFNPCIWMLDASLREVHEYEADDAVLRRGISARDYQLLLIEKAVAGTHYSMVNTFNHSLLKNRITMMTKQKSPKWARLKVLYAVPVTLIAIGAMANGRIKTLPEENTLTSIPIKVEQPKENTPISTPIKVEQPEEKTPVNTPIKVKSGTLRLVVDGQEMTPQKAIETVRGKEIKNSINTLSDGTTELLVTTSVPDDKVYDKPEVLPEYPGGTDKFWGYLREAVKYPQEAQEWGVQGRIHVEFIVEKDGSISNVKLITGADKLKEIVVIAYKPKDDSPEEIRKENEDKGRIALQEEAIRVVKAMPKWKPGTVGGKPVRTKFVLPIMFRLS